MICEERLTINDLRFTRTLNSKGVRPNAPTIKPKPNQNQKPMRTTINSLRALALAMTIGATATAQTIADFENLQLQPESFWNGSDGGTGFASGHAFFPTSYHTEWDFWQSGFAYSNVTDNTTAGFMNLYGVITGSGYDGSANFAVAQNNSIVRLNGPAESVQGLYVTNSTYVALSMAEGDDFAKQFGSPLNAAGEEDGTNGEDWFLLTVVGFLDGEQTTESVEFYLADFRFEDDADDYILTDWQWVDLSPLGLVDSIRFSLSSSDVGTWGMNTPAFFCIDNLTTQDADPTSIADANAGVSFSVFPNPTADVVTVRGIAQQNVRVMDMQGRTLMTQGPSAADMATFDLSALPSGIYLMEVWGQDSREVSRLVKL